MKIVGVIPARYASSRFPGKPLADIHGKPMIWWVYQQAKKAAELDEVLVATDDERIAEAVKTFGGKYVMTSLEHKTPNDRAAEVAFKVEGDMFVVINGDEPLLDPNAITASLPSDDEYSEFYSSNVIIKFTSPVELADPANIKAVFNKKGEAMWISRAPIPYPKGSLEFEYWKVIGVAAMSRKALEFFVSTPRSKLEEIEELDIYRFLENGKTVYLKKADAHTLSVDTPKDLERVRALIVADDLERIRSMAPPPYQSGTGTVSG
jgi:3-deoxy-manno-octulosonate cytidylyltransferase (CMP-KDO synthetase)